MERKKEVRKTAWGLGRESFPPFSLAPFFAACALFSLHVFFFRSTEREPSTSYDPFSGESRLTSFNTFPNIIFFFNPHLWPNFGKSCFPDFSQKPYPIKVFLNPAVYFGQISDPWNTLLNSIKKGQHTMRVWLEASWARNCIRVHCIAELSTLPDNPGDSRFWTISPSLQIRVWNLPDNRRSLPFLARFDFHKMKFQIFCLIWAILLLTLNVSSQIPVCRCNISNYSVIGGK